MIRLEIKKIVKRRSFTFISLLCVLVSVLDALTNMYICYGKGLSEVYPAYTMSVLNNVSRSPFRIVFVVMLPIVASVVASDIYSYDREKNINSYIITRKNKAEYIKSQAISIFAVVSLLIFTALIINLGLCLVAFPKYGNYLQSVKLPDTLVLMQSNEYVKYELFQKLKLSHPYINLVFFIFMRSIIAGIFALVSYGISILIKVNRYIVFIISFLLYNFVEFVELFLERLLIESSFVKLTYSGLLNMNPTGNILTYFKDILLYSIIVIFTIYFGTKKEEI